MDGSRFDDLAAWLASRPSRRSALRVMIGAGVGLAAPLAAAAKGRKHHHHKSCQTNLDCPGQKLCETNRKGKQTCTLGPPCPSPNNFCKSEQFAACCAGDTPVCCAGSQVATCNAAGCVCGAQGFCSI